MSHRVGWVVASLFFALVGCIGPAWADWYVSAASRNSVLRFADDGTLLGDFVTPGAGGLTNPQGITFGPDGHLYASSFSGTPGNNRVLRFDGETGSFLNVFASVSNMVWPAEINFRGSHLYVSDFSAGTTGRVSRFDATTGVLVDHFATGINRPDGQVWDANGDLYVSAFGTNSIRKFNGTTGASSGNFVATGVGGLAGPLDLLILPNGEFLVSSFNNNSVKRYSAAGVSLGNAISGLSGPQGLAIGPDGMLYAGSFTTGTINRYDINTFALLNTFAVAGNSTTNNFVYRANAIPEPGLACTGLLVAVGMLLFRRGRRRAPH